MALAATRLRAIDGGDTTPTGRRYRTRIALIDAGEALMAARSVDAISIDEIVDAAGVAKGTFYNHFPDKEALQRAILERIRGDIRLEIDRLNDDIADPARRVLRAFCLAQRYAVDDPRRGNFLVRTSMAFRFMRATMNEGLIRDISVGLEEGRFPIASTESGALLMLGITQAALVQTLDGNDRFAVTARAQQMGAMLLRGLGLVHAEAEMIAAQEADNVLRVEPTDLQIGDAVR